jgi:hypothetical protein
MRPGAIGTGRHPGARSVERSEDEGRAPAPHRQRQYRPHQLEGRFTAEALVRVDSGGKADPVTELYARLAARRHAENRLAFGERVAELGIVAVEDDVGGHRQPLLCVRQCGPPGCAHDNHQTCPAQPTRPHAS